MALKTTSAPSSSGTPEELRVRERRYRQEKGKTIDLFFRSWMMLKVSGQESVGFFNSKRKLREMAQYMHDLCLTDFEPSEALTAEWQDFLRTWLRSCYESRNYRSSVFGLIPISDEALTEKIVNEINLVTRDAPAELGKAEAFLPLRREAIHVFADMLQNGDALRERYFPGE